MDPIDDIKTELQVLEDRISDLEHKVLSVPKSKPTRNWMLVLFVVSLGLALGPKDFQLNGFAYQSDGVPPETITSILGIYAAGKWGIERYQEDNDG